MPTRTEKQKAYQAHLDAAAAQGLSLKAYADAHDLNVHQLYAYRRRLRAQPFVKVRAQGPAPGTAVPLSIRLPNGLTVSMTLAPDQIPTFLQRLAAL